MGLYDILQKHNVEYNKLVELINDLRGCVDFDAAGVVRQLDELYDDTEYKHDFGPKKNGVYVVRQTQPAEYFQDKPIAVFDNKEQADTLSRALNKEYGYGVRFDENFDFIESDDDYDYDDVHYYDWDFMEMNPALEKFGVENNKEVK